MNAWILLAVLGAVSLALRSVVILTAERFPVPERALAWCALLGPAILAALLGGSIVASSTGGRAEAELLPLVVGATVAVRSGSTGAALGAGLGTHALMVFVG